MRIAALIYHDVISGPQVSSGFEGAGADWYKISVDRFEEQLDLLRASVRSPLESGGTIQEVPSTDVSALTFDDGGSSSLQPIADLLESRNLRGRFFVVTDRIATPGFLDEVGIRELFRRGHVIGTHSASHRTPFAKLPFDQQVAEWRGSRDRLEQILGASVVTGSVPGGAYDYRVAQSAAEAGLRLLFTSEPQTVALRIHGLLVAGRYMVTRTTSASEIAAVLQGDAMLRAKRWFEWNARKVAKGVAGDAYDLIREKVLSRRRNVPPKN